MPLLSQTLSQTFTARNHASLRSRTALAPARGDRAIAGWPWAATGGRGIVGTFLARWKAARQLQSATRPVLLAAARPRGAWARILVPVDFSAASLAAASLAASMDAQLVFLACFTAADGTAPEASAHVRSRLARLVQQLNIRHDRVSVVVRRGPLDAAAGAYAGLMRADLIVVGRRRDGAGTLSGRPEWHLARGIGRDLLVVPA